MLSVNIQKSVNDTIESDNIVYQVHCPECNSYKYYNGYPTKQSCKCVHCDRSMGLSPINRKEVPTHKTIKPVRFVGDIHE